MDFMGRNLRTFMKTKQKCQVIWKYRQPKPTRYMKKRIIFVSNILSGERSSRADRSTSDARFRTKAYDWRSHLQRRFWSWRSILSILVFIANMKFRLSASCVCSVSNRQRSLGERRLREGAGNGRSRWMHRRTWCGERKEDWKAWHARLRRGWGSYYFSRKKDIRLYSMEQKFRNTFSFR